jgi:hypothetical protein
MSVQLNAWRARHRLSIGLQGKIMGLGFLELKDPRAMLELIAVVKLDVVSGSIDPHFVNDFEPAVSEPAQSIGMTLVLLAMMLIVNLGPDTAGQTLLCKKVHGMTKGLLEASFYEISEQGPLAPPVVFGQPSCGSLAMTVIEPGQDVRQRYCDSRRSYSQPRSASLCRAASLGHE